MNFLFSLGPKKKKKKTRPAKATNGIHTGNNSSEKTNAMFLDNRRHSKIANTKQPYLKTTKTIIEFQTLK